MTAKYLILMGEAGQRIVVDPGAVQLAEEVAGGKVYGESIRLHMAGGAEVEVYGLSITRFWDEIKDHYRQ
jgi:hypothetical protein